MLSSERLRLVEDETYKNFFAYIKPQENVLDFGCGQGYVSLLCATSLAEQEIDTHVYACDYQEDLLDLFWKHIVDKKLSKITPFFVPNHNRIVFPPWIPPINHVIFSFSLSTVKNVSDIFRDLQPILTDKTKIHVVEWNPQCEDSSLENVFPMKYRIEKQTVLQAINEHGYQVEKNYYFSQKTVYSFTASKI